MNRKLRMGMVGGGKDAFIGSIHRLAANMDGLIEVVAGAKYSSMGRPLNSSPVASRITARHSRVAPCFMMP